jgi:hypothetical protein
VRAGGSGRIPASLQSFPLAYAGEQPQHVDGNIKHYVTNDQETGRSFVNSVVSKRAIKNLICSHFMSPFPSQIPV